MGPRPRPVWRRLMKVLAALFGLVLCLVAGGFLLLHTDWARGKVRGILVGELDKRLNGSVTVGRLEGDLLDKVTLRDVAVRDRAGKLVLRADSLSLDYRVLPLMNNHFHADELAVDGLEADLRRLPDGRLAVADLWIQQPPSDGPPWTVTLADITLTRSAVTIESKPGQLDELSGIDIEAAVTVGEDATDVELRSLAAQWTNHQLALALVGHLRVLPEGGGLIASGVELTSDESHVLVPHAVWGPAAQNAAFVVKVSAAELSRLLPESRLVADVQMAGFAVRDPETERARATLFGGSGNASLALWAELAGDTSAGQTSVFWTGVDPEALATGAPKAMLAGWLVGDAAGLTRPWPPPTRGMSANFRGGLRGRFRGQPLSAVALQARLSNKRLTADVEAGVPGGEAKADLAAVLPDDLARIGAIALERANLTAKVRDVGPIAAALGQPPTTGPVAVEATASGPLENLTVRARVDSAGLARKELRLSGLRADVRIQRADVQRFPGVATGNAELHVDSIANAGRAYGDAHVIATLSDSGSRANLRFHGGGKQGISARGALSARIAPDAVRVAFHELRIVTRKLVWQGRGGRLEVIDGGRKLGGDLALSSAAGSLRVSAELTRSRDLHGPIRWQLTGIDLARILDEVGREGVRGKISSSGELRLPAGPGRFRLDAEQVAWKGAPGPMNGRLRAALAGRRLNAEVDFDGSNLGDGKAQVVVRTPAALLDAAAWRRMRTSAVESLRVEIEDLDMARVVHSVDDSAAAKRLRAGVADVTLEAGRALESGKLTVAVTGGEVAASTELILPVTLNFDAELARATLTSTVRVDAADQGKVEVEAALLVPARPFDGAAWRRQGLDLLRSARVRVIDFNIARLERLRGKRAGRTIAPTGTVTADIVSDPAARSLTATISVRDVRATTQAQPIAGELTARVQGRTTDVSLSMRLPSGPVLEGTLQAGLGADALRGFDVARLERQLRGTSLRGSLRVPNQPVVRLASAVAVAPQVSGQIGGELTVAGTMASPIFTARMDAPGFTAQGVRFDRLHLRGDYRAGPWTANIDARQADGGRVVLNASGSPSANAPLKVHLMARRLRLGLLTPLWKRPGATLTHLEGDLQADLDISGTTERPIIDGNVLVRRGEARIAKFLRPISAARLDVRFRRSVAQISLAATARPGTVELAGTLNLSRPSQARFTAKLKAKKLPIEAGKQIVSIDGTVSASGFKRGPMWDADLLIERGLVVRLPSQKGLELHDSGPLDDVVFVDAAGAAQAAAQEELKAAAAPAMRLRINSQDLIELRSDELALDLRIQLTSTQIGGTSSVQGTIEAVRGWVEIVGRRYSVERGWVVFDGEIPPNPRLDVRLSNRFPDTTVYVDVTGRKDNPEVTFASNSGQYDQAQLLGMVMGGDSPGGQDASQGARATSAAYGLVANQVAGVIRQAGLPVDVLRVKTDPKSQSEGQLSEVTVGKWLSERLFVAYRYRPEAEEDNKNRNEGAFQHFFAKDWMWEGVVGSKANSIDLLWVVPLGR